MSWFPASSGTTWGGPSTGLRHSLRHTPVLSLEKPTPLDTMTDAPDSQRPVPQATVAHLERRVTRRLLSALTVHHVYGLCYYFWKHRYLVTRPQVRAAP